MSGSIVLTVVAIVCVLSVAVTVGLLLIVGFASNRGSGVSDARRGWIEGEDHQDN